MEKKEVSSRKIIVIEDDDSFNQLIRLVLEKEGYFVKPALSGKEALEIIDNDNYQILWIDRCQQLEKQIELKRKNKN